MESCVLPLGLRLERDLYFRPAKTLGQYADEARAHGSVRAWGASCTPLPDWGARPAHKPMAPSITWSRPSRHASCRPSSICGAAPGVSISKDRAGKAFYGG